MADARVESMCDRFHQTFGHLFSACRAVRCRLDKCLEMMLKEKNEEIGEDKIAAAERQSVT